MSTTIFFADSTLIFSDIAPKGDWHIISSPTPDAITRDKIVKIIESNKLVALIDPDWEALYDRFCSEFISVEAAGGVVENGVGERLMIVRNSRWDLPKGHLERGESIAQCAVREIAEETGVEAVVERELCQTLHAYSMRGRWELKRTHWFLMRSQGEQQLTAQSEEGIVEVVWCSAERVAQNLERTYPTIRYVMGVL